GDGLIVFADLFDELAGERALADAAAAGDGDDFRRLRGRAEGGEDVFGVLAAGDEADEARQREAVAALEPPKQVVKRGRHRGAPGGRRRCPAAACPARRRGRRPSPSAWGCPSPG